MLPAVSRSDDRKAISRDGISEKGNGQQSVGRSLAQLAIPGPQLAVKPEDSIVQFGKEVTLSIVDGQLSPTDESVFRLEYDPSILELKRLDDAELARNGEVARDGSESKAGTIVFHLARSGGQALRTVGVTFFAKAPGVSPVRVEVLNSGNPVEASHGAVGAGVIRVR
jgi:hypothetical protein